MADGDDITETQELKQEQARKEADELQQLKDSDQPDEALQHERRSEKAAYLKEKLAERERAEREAEGG